ncbi:MULTISPECIES: hypothetical protein [unclassified Paenibacillus]|uniref:GNAT family N-acetyltransferase n=1 Tax=unclassified Paenibacillus TaxID=185978 RepID=UPI000413F4C2
MSQFPELETKRLVLRELTQNDSTELFQFFSLDEVTKFYDAESFTTIKQAEELIQRWMKDMKQVKPFVGESLCSRKTK